MDKKNTFYSVNAVPFLIGVIGLYFTLSVFFGGHGFFNFFFTLILGWLTVGAFKEAFSDDPKGWNLSVFRIPEGGRAGLMIAGERSQARLDWMQGFTNAEDTQMVIRDALTFYHTAMFRSLDGRVILEDPNGGETEVFFNEATFNKRMREVLADLIECRPGEPGFVQEGAAEQIQRQMQEKAAEDAGVPKGGFQMGVHPDDAEHTGPKYDVLEDPSRPGEFILRDNHYFSSTANRQVPQWIMRYYVREMAQDEADVRNADLCARPYVVVMIDWLIQRGPLESAEGVLDYEPDTIGHGGKFTFKPKNGSDCPVEHALKWLLEKPDDWKPESAKLKSEAVPAAQVQSYHAPEEPKP